MLRALLACLAALLSSQYGAALAGEQVVSREDQLRAAYLFNFMKFVEWPPEAASDVLTVCFVGADAVRE
ncbi:MAG TPA: YfiR family protein, partial [Steroidobacteraceae bacterium]